MLTPQDLEETYGLTGGHIFHGEQALDQIFTMRPLLGWARYRTPIAGLYLCGAGTHPGGRVTGGPGANAAREIAADLRRKVGSRFSVLRSGPPHGSQEPVEQAVEVVDAVLPEDRVAPAVVRPRPQSLLHRLADRHVLLLDAVGEREGALELLGRAGPLGVERVPLEPRRASARARAG